MKMYLRLSLMNAFFYFEFPFFCVDKALNEYKIIELMF